MKRPENEQEVIILGSGLGGLVAGALLAKSKCSVLLLREKGYQPSYAKKGYHFIPFSNLSEKRFSASLLKKVSEALNLPFLKPRAENKQARIILDGSKERVAFQLVLPRARIDISPLRFLSQKEWKREFPKELVKIEEFYNELDQMHHLLQKAREKQNSPPFFPLGQHSFAKKLFSFNLFPEETIDKRLLSFSREFREFLQLQLTSWGNYYSDRSPLSLAAQILSGEGNELNADFDLENLEKEILNQFLRSGGRAEEIDGVKKIDRGWRKGFALWPEGDPRVFGSRFLIFNSPLHRISGLFWKKGNELLKWGEKIRPRYMMIPLFLGIREKAIPVGMKDLLISMLDLDKPYDDGNVLFLSLSPKGDETKAPEGKRALTVESLMDFGKWEQTLPLDYQQGVMKHLYHLFPFLENGIEFVDSHWASDHVPKWSYSHFLYQVTSDFYWKEGVVPMSMARNIYFVGKENFPYLGLEGEIFAGFTAAQRILKKY
jgi:hypothetical protein